MPRTYDLVLFGATGFAGGLTAEYLARTAPPGLTWALAGRSAGKLEAVREHLAGIDPRCADLPLLHADCGDPGSLRDLTEQTRVVASTVGPFLEYGEPLVAACAEAGIDYADLTAEPEFVDLVYLRHHERARETGARLVHACGFDSVPYDLGAHYTVQQLPEGVPLRVDGFLRADLRPSSGTMATVLGIAARPLPMVRAARDRRKAEAGAARPGDRRARAAVVAAPRRSRELRAWALPMPTLDPQIVARSAAALERYGPDFRYRQYAAFKWLPVAAAGVAGAGAFAALAQLPPARRFLAARLTPGAGPSEERRARSWFSVRFLGEGGGRRVLTEVVGGDPGYDETAKMLGESAMCLALDKLPGTAGQVTTAQAMGEALTERLTRAGITFRVLKTSP